MKEFTIYRDQKITLWQRETYIVEAESEDDAVMLIEKGDVYTDELETLWETIQDITPTQNNGAETVEYLNEKYELISKNK